MITEYDDKYFGDVLDLIKKFQKESLGEFGFGVDENVCKGTFEACKKYGLFLIKDDRCIGVIAGAISTALMDNKPIWNEIIWYVDPKYRSKGMSLYFAMEKKLRNMGIKNMVMVSMCNSMHEKIDKLYKKLKFKPFEVQYIKSLEE